jgi:hypothetical protein
MFPPPAAVVRALYCTFMLPPNELNMVPVWVRVRLPGTERSPFASMCTSSVLKMVIVPALAVKGDSNITAIAANRPPNFTLRLSIFRLCALNPIMATMY